MLKLTPVMVSHCGEVEQMLGEIPPLVVWRVATAEMHPQDCLLGRLFCEMTSVQ